MAHVDGRVEKPVPSDRLGWSTFCKSRNPDVRNCQGVWATNKFKKCSCPCHDDTLPEGLI